MAMNDTDQAYRLPCGRDVEAVWAHLDVEASDHERTCEHCQATRHSLTVLRDLTTRLAEDDTPPPRDLTSRIMAAVRADLRRHELLGEQGGVQISTQAVAAVLRFAADTVPGVRARRCRVTASDAHTIDVSMTLAVAYGQFHRDALNEVRTRVTAAAQARIGVHLARLDLTVEDLYRNGGQA